MISICFSLHDFILQSQALHIGCVACTLPVASVQQRSSILCHVIIMCLLSAESMNEVNPKSTATQLESTHALLSVGGSKGAVLEVYVWYCRESVDCVA